MKPITILLAEDSYGDQTLFALALKESNRGTSLIVVTNGDEATDYLWRRGKYTKAVRPDLVILDINLPRKKGPQLLAEIRNEPSLKGLPIAIMTGAKATRELAATCKVNANFYVLKPDNTDEYFAVIKALEEYSWNMAACPEAREEYAEKLRQLLPAVSAA